MRLIRVVAMAFVAAVHAAGTAGAQATAPAPPAADTGAWGTMSAVLVLAALIVAVAFAVKLIDLRRKRTAEAVHLQSLLSDALLRDERLHGTTVTPTVRVPFWSGSPATVALTGHVGDEAQRETALEVVRAEATRLRPDVVVEDRLGVEVMARAA
jgi:hypothetical protein